MIGCLCIHGFTGGPYELEPLTDYLQQETDWILEVPTLPGHGYELTLEDQDHEGWINEAERAFLSLKERVDHVYIIGFSMGGMIAAHLAAKYDVHKLVLLSPSRKYLSLKQLTVEASHIVMDKVSGTIEDNFTYQNYKHKKGAIPVRAYLEFLKCMKVTRPSLKKITCPVLVAQGIQDGVVPFKAAHYLDKEIPVDIEVIYYLDSKHLICLGDDKDVVSVAVEKFLSTNQEKQNSSSVNY
ncbi:esterase/lipase [Natronobacillus azotifigens]|uniref:Alpha/beta fold hydrolase n=1 Tax=Natronobacillus azotifigens TaxID=472978 RepID=A0A9J6RAV0_9BACI|nr:alpha/beta fold hydrolase [Natronobacillus azotifigens]MCZ0702693.1 alpha/beta fold hydrolase [Natronobacillus azotifigens]